MLTRLLVLWVLSERSSYGYEIKRALVDEGMGFWFGIEDASVYSVLRTLERNGHTRVVGVERAGVRPQRTRYELTAQGRSYYKALLIEALATPVLPIAPIDVALAARGDLHSSEIALATTRRADALDELLAGADAARQAAPSPAIVDRCTAILRAERTWLRSLDQSTIT